MEWHVVQLKADIDTLEILESHWTLLHQDGIHSAYRFGVVSTQGNQPVPNPGDPDPDPQVAFPYPYNTITEEQAIEGTKILIGEEGVLALEQSCLDEILAKQNPETISGTPWAPQPPVLPVAPPASNPILDPRVPIPGSVPEPQVDPRFPNRNETQSSPKLKVK